MSARKVPVTIVTGFLGAGKTTLVRHVIENAGGRRLALIVRGADTAALDLAPEAAGLLAASLGLSRIFRDDLAQLDAAMPLYDAFFRWARDATAETHNWPTPGTKP